MLLSPLGTSWLMRLAGTYSWPEVVVLCRLRGLQTVPDPLPDLPTTDGDGEVLTLVGFHALLALSNEPICIAQKLILWI
jgi:hypothetical protein